MKKKELPKIEYSLGKERRKELKEIKEFLFTVKNSYIFQLDSIYKDNPNLRLL